MINILAFPMFKKIYLKAREPTTDKQIFHFSGSLPKGSQQWSLASFEVRSQEIYLGVSHMGERGSSTWSILYCLPSCVSRNLGWKQSIWNVNQHSDMRCRDKKHGWLITLPCWHSFQFFIFLIYGVVQSFFCYLN